MIEGLIYKTQPYLESARLLFTYTKNGKITLIAQGAQKLNHPYRVLGQYLTQISFTEAPKSMYTLKEAKLINDFSILKDDYNSLKDASLILEIIDKLIVDNFPHDRIYEQAISALSAPNINLSALSFALKMLKLFGYSINLTPDGRKIIGINIDEGGLIYEGDNEIIDLDVTESTWLLKLVHMPYEALLEFPISTYDKIKSFTLKYYQYHLQTTLKALQ